MGIRHDFERRITKKQQEIEQLELQIRDAKSYLQALHDSLKLIPRDRDGGDNSGTDLRPGSALAKARDAIRKAGKPLHINELLSALGKTPDKKSRISLAGSLSSYARKHEIFAKTAPNTFGLQEFAPPTDEDLPDSFGSV
jgi:hypothetical protein